jgi:hypothetical protein
MFKIFKRYGVSDKIISLIKAMYRDTEAQVRTDDGLSDFFKINAGVLQGDTLAPFLFIWVVDWILRQAIKETGIGYVLKSGSVRTEIKLSELAFADDVVLVTNSTEEAQKLLRTIEKYAQQVGLYLNAKKTEIMICSGNMDRHKDTTTPVYALDGTLIKVVDDFKYLGSWINNSMKDVNVRIGQAWTAATKMRNIWTSFLTEELKRKFFQATIVSILLYGCETWTMTVAIQKKLDGAYTKLLRYISNVSWRDHIPNSVLYSGLPIISSVVRQRRLRFAGHCYRATNQPIHHLVFKETDCRRGKGATKTYPKMILEDVNTIMSGKDVITEEEDAGEPRTRGRKKSAPKTVNLEDVIKLIEDDKTSKRFSKEIIKNSLRYL